MAEPAYDSPRCRHRCVMWALIGAALGFVLFALAGCATVPPPGEPGAPLVILQRHCDRELRLIVIAHDGRRLYAPAAVVLERPELRAFLEEVMEELKASRRPAMVDQLNQDLAQRCGQDRAA